MKKTLTILGLFILLQLIVSDTPEALACSGFRPFELNDLQLADTLVLATVIDTDDRGFNAVLRVEDYYKGEGDRLLTVMRYTQGFSSGALVRGYDTGCAYAGSGPTYQKGAQGYFLLVDTGNGVYTDFYETVGHLFAFDGMMYFKESWTDGNGIEQFRSIDLSEADFIEMMLEEGGRNTPISPNDPERQFYPLQRFLNITTENGTRYQINPDRSVSEMPDDGPLAISPDGSHVAFRMDEDRIGFQYILTQNHIVDGEPEEAWRYPGVIVSGESLRFSQDSNFVAVWDAAGMTIYMFTNYHDGGYGMWMEMLDVAHIDFPAMSDAEMPSVMWSSDSTTVVWQAGDGVWHWNLVEEAEPQQLLLNDDLETFNGDDPSLMDVSQHGHFVRVGLWSDWVLIDAETGEEYPNAIASPDERFLMHPYESDLLIERDDEQYCVPPLRENCTVRKGFRAHNYFYYDVNMIGFGPCFEDSPHCCFESISWNPAIQTQFGRRSISKCIVGMQNLMVYDQQYGQVALVVDDYNIYFEFYSLEPEEFEVVRPQLNVLELADVIDSPIASIEWGQPVFYDTYHLANTEDIP